MDPGDWGHFTSLLVRLLGAGVLAAVLGYERERHERPAGLRTHILVCLGAALLTMVSESYPTGGERSRISSQIVSGIGFLGAGTILRTGNIVRGLTTAASVWTVAALGIAAARGGIFFALAGVTTLLAYLTLTTLNRVEARLTAKRGAHELVVLIRDPEHNTELLTETVSKAGGCIEGFHRLPTDLPGAARVTYTVRMPSGDRVDSISKALSGLPWLAGFEWQ